MPVICALQKHSPQPAQQPGHLRPQRVGSGISRKIFLMPGPPETWEVDFTRVARGWSIAHSDCSLGTKHKRKGRDPRGNARTAGLGRPTASPLARFRFRLHERGIPAVTNAASRAALKKRQGRLVQVKSLLHGSSRTLGVRVSRIKQVLPSFYLAVISLMHPATVQTFFVMCPAPSPSRLSDPTHKRSMWAARDS